jgi:4-amino-4-deoxy-L-arabinose transferase-like glycosyltransferase
MNSPSKVRLDSVFPVTLLAGLLLGSTTVFYSWTGSTSIYSYIAYHILDGGVAYRDAWDIKGPGVYYFFALGHGLFGPSPMAFRILEVFWETGAALALAALALRIYGTQAAGMVAGVGYVVLYFSQNFWNFGISDGLLTFPLAIAYLLTVRAMSEDRYWQWMVAGFLVGVAALFKLPFGLAGAPLLWAAWVAGPRDWSGIVRRWSGLAVGLAACFAGTALYFAATGAWDAFYSAYILAAFAHAEHYRSALQLACAMEMMPKPVRYPLYGTVLLAVAGLFVPARSTRAVGQRRAEMLLLAWLVVGIVVFVMHGGFTDYFFLPLIAPGAVLLGGLFGHLWRKEGWSWQRWVAVGGLAVLLVIPATKFGQHAAYARRFLQGYRPEPFMHELSEMLRANTTPEDRIFVWGEIGEIYLDTGRRSPSRFATTFHLGTPLPGVNYREIFLGEFQANLPKYFVLIKSEKPNHPCAAAVVDMDAAYNQFAELRALVESRFHVVEETPGYVVYLRN